MEKNKYLESVFTISGRHRFVASVVVAILTLNISPSTSIEDEVKEHMEKIKQKYPHVGVPRTNKEDKFL